MKPIESASLPALLAAIRHPTEATSPGGATTATHCVRHHHAGCVLWTVMTEYSRQGNRLVPVSSRILCWELEGDDSSGWTATPLREAHDLRHVTCPLEYLSLVPVWSAVWREQVWSHHEAELTRQTEGKVAG